ncbi:XrtA-associated tyrosine autokinase [Parahaliea mediterranea]|uniref:non-specific protein-tyrosine kinase n=1 Tax=Parahaliea mediterranea TaxID=651086 RepID=A0A939DG62_9GAMM|nr:XrtA-associated tyrosine autokinase [Parahaliea mediterranea]MBN7797454.1 AAA family ATPase [Parahaliea mediterranea]
MSIIEKAVGELGKRKNTGREPVEADAPTAVQRASDSTTAAAVVATDEARQARRELPVEPEASRGVIEIPFNDLHKKGMLTPAIPRSAIAEEYRTIKRPILKNIDGHVTTKIPFANLVMVTSALQGDGKTFSSINLALSIAMEMDKTVLFVDADIAKATAGKLLGVPPKSQGLIDILENKGVTPGDVLLRTNMEKLSILPAGNVHEHANELLASSGMRALMVELSERYSDRVIVFDSPPLLLTTEAGVLASFMGQIVFVVRADHTPQQAVVEALEHIGPDKMVGTVLNRARRRRVSPFGYGYSYGYGYGYGYGASASASDGGANPRYRGRQPDAGNGPEAI